MYAKRTVYGLQHICSHGILTYAYHETSPVHFAVPFGDCEGWGASIVLKLTPNVVAVCIHMYVCICMFECTMV